MGASDVENERFLHSNGLVLVFHRAVLPGCLPVPLPSGAIEAGSTPVLLIHRAKEVPLQISRLQQRMLYLDNKIIIKMQKLVRNRRMCITHHARAHELIHKFKLIHINNTHSQLHLC